MVVGILETIPGLLLLSLVFSLPIVGVYLSYELVWPRLSGAVTGRETGDGVE